MENNTLVKTNNNPDDNSLNSLIYEIKVKQVMLDSDLARLYQCKNSTKSMMLRSMIDILYWIIKLSITVVLVLTE